MPTASPNGIPAYPYKGIILGTCLILPNTYWIAQLEVVRYTHPTLVVPFFNVIFILSLCVSLNLVGVKICRNPPLRPSDLVTVYLMLSISSAIASIDFLQVLISNLGHAFYFATSENEWRTVFLDSLPVWLMVDDEAALQSYYQGGATLFDLRQLKPWILPTVTWIGFILVLFLTMLCLCHLVQRQWIDKEKLTYPIIHLPLEILSAKPAFLNNKLMWSGLVLAALISLNNGLHFFWPSLAEVPVKRQSISHLFSHLPWNSIGGVRLSFYPFVIGVSFLIPLDLLSSCWIFYWLHKGQRLLGGLAGWRGLSRFPYQNEQALGVVIGLTCFMLWKGKSYLKTLAQPNQLARDRLFPAERLALFGLAGGLLILLLFSKQIGMALPVIPIFFALYFLVSVFIARMRAELGLCVHGLAGLEPRRVMMNWLGSKALNKETLVSFALYGFFNRVYRSHPMPHLLEGFKMSTAIGTPVGWLLPTTLLSVVASGLVVFYVYLDLYYQFGAASGYFGPWTLGFGRETFTRLQNWLHFPSESDPLGLVFTGLGLLGASLLMLLRTRFLGFPLHPLGYAMAGDWGMSNLWSCFFTSFLLKWAIFKFGGLQSYRKVVPFFLGLALGDLVMGSLWSLIGVLMDETIYQPFP